MSGSVQKLNVTKGQGQTATVFSAANLDYIAAIYQKFLQNPSEVDSSWGAFFRELGDNAPDLMREIKGASWEMSEQKIAAVLAPSVGTEFLDEPKKEQTAKKESAKQTPAPAPAPPVQLSAVAQQEPQASSSEAIKAAAEDTARAMMLIKAYRERGHMLANLDPLNLTEEKYHPDLDPASYGFKLDDFDRTIYLGAGFGLREASLRDILARLQSVYCGTMGVEYMHIQDPTQKRWLMQRLEEGQTARLLNKAQKKSLLDRLIAAEGFETFLDKKYQGTKRFGVEGGESLIPAVEAVIAKGAELGVREVVLGMAHRGRLNMLTNVFAKPFTAMFSEFNGTPAKPDDVQGSGDVKYHMGASADREFAGHSVHLSLTANPSHLEFVDPVVVGKVRAKQVLRGDHDGSKIMPILVHGDAAVAGQGVVAETLMMSELPGYRVGGTMHIVINNQVGFTTSPQYARSGPYCTEVAKMVMAPIFHVNGDDPETVLYVAKLAAEFRQIFKKDVFIDLVCYRKQGHNEADEPAFTQPLMYKAIKQKRPVRDIYTDQLIAENMLTPDEATQMYDMFKNMLEDDFKAAQTYKPNKADMLEGDWKGIELAPNDDRRGQTAITLEMAQQIGKALTKIPAGFDLNAKIARQLEAKAKMFETGEGFDWATAEALAFGALLLEGNKIRFSGQDVRRGTFSHRHAVWRDQTNEAHYIPLNHIADKQAQLDIHDSLLSEMAVLGFEYGYSLADPHALTLWEAQFGDFVNGAQVMIDQFIASSEAKWLRMSGLVMLLPHGFEGQGPEHSSSRIERFLQLAAEDNIQVLNCSTPASYFHALRRQIRRNFRKPLVIATPKSLLRHKLCVSPLKMMTGSESFHRVLFDDVAIAPAKEIKRVVICTGKVYYDLFEEREKRGIKNVAFLRMEQLYPFPAEALAEELKKYPNADVVWCQEEPENQGAWTFVDRRIEAVLERINHKTKRVLYAGRPEAASPATGSYKQHNKEQAKLLADALVII
jgi:2-oxoglutarate dehydrogenase E1 component